MTNTALATYETVAGVDSVRSNTIGTTLVFPNLTIAKDLDGPAIAHLGQSFSYTIRFANTSATTVARDVVVIDTLAAALRLVSSDPMAESVGQVVRWSIGDLAPGDSSTVTLTVRVHEDVRDTVSVSNRATLTASNGSAVAAVAAAVQAIGLRTTQLGLAKTADVLEVGIGESVPFTLLLENTGISPIGDVWIHDRLPAGTRLVQQSIAGADSVLLDDGQLSLRIAGTLSPGGTRTVRYALAVVSTTTEVIANSAYATAEAGFIQSAESVAWVRIRRHWPMETRVAIGKVWLDEDDDGIQDAGEPGVEGIDIWTDDGEVVTTDSEGKFSFRNLRPGRHAFRLDRTTVPASYRFDGSGISGDIRTIDMDGWTTPRVNFRVVPAAGQVDRLYLPYAARFSARPVCQSVRQHFPEGKPIVVAHFAEGSIEPEFLIDPTRNRDRLFGAMSASAACPVEIAGHTDSLPTQPSEVEDLRLTEARARTVLQIFRRHSILGEYVVIRGYGATEPIAAGTDFLARQLNRRVELRLVGPPRIEYQLEVSNANGVTLDGIVAQFEPRADSAVIVSGEAIVGRTEGGSVELPPLLPGAQLLIRAWAVSTDESARVTLRSGLPDDRHLTTAVVDPVEWSQAHSYALADSTTLPDPTIMALDMPVELVLRPSRDGQREMTYALPKGWELADESDQAAEQTLQPEVRRDRDGQPLLRWTFSEGAPLAHTVRLRPSTGRDSAAHVTVPALRTPEERAAERRSALVSGPGVEIFEPSDGTVFPTDRVYIGVRGEPSALVSLFTGDSLLAEGTIRPDGVHDFIAVELPRGPHRLRARMRNSWNQERWDSLAVHVTDTPHKFVGPSGPEQLLADGHTVHTFRVRLIDRWNVPVIVPTYATVSAEGAEPIGPDRDPTSVGVQVQSDRQGWVVVALTPGRDVGRGTVTVSAGTLTTAVALELLPAIRPLMLTGVGRVGFGAAPDPFGAVTARGRLDKRTSLVLSYDSRLLDAGQEIFGRSFDPLGETQYPILGDAGRQRSAAASRYAFSARLERGFDWMALGDIPTTDFAAGLNLTTYRRALTGGAARVTTGPVVWRGFGSLTRRTLMQKQIRGAGASGPYQLQRDMIAGTEEIALETRARENAQRILTRQVLVRFVDYQIDYERGTLLFRRPVPAADPQENPVFIMLTYEAEGGGEERIVGGLRASLDARGLVQGALDSLRIGATGIRSDEGGGAHHLAGLDVRFLQVGGLDLGAEVSYSDTPDSSGFAAALEGGVQLFDGIVDVNAAWMKIDSGFGNPSKTALRGGTEELKLSGAVRIGPSELHVRHERQSFGAQGVERHRTHAGIVQRVGSKLQIDAGHASDIFQNGSAADRSQAGEVKLTWAPIAPLTLWSEGRHQFTYEGNVVRPNHLAAGAALQINRRLSVEVQHRYVMPNGDPGYAVSNFGVRSHVGLGTQVWGSYQLAGAADGQYNAAVIGLNNQLRLGPAFTFNALFERREGLDQAALTDPVRALPFLQAEEDYWTAGLGVEFLPPQAPYRLTARGEYRDGDIRSSRLVTVAGDVALSQSFAILSRQEFLQTEQQLSGDTQLSRRLSTLWGVAFRPARTDALNMLAKFQWVDETNPLGTGVLTRAGNEVRLIGTAEMIWAPIRSTEIAWRYAMRKTQLDRGVDLDDPQTRTSWADYIGARINLDLSPWLALRNEGRLLIERTSDARRWDTAPSVVLTPVEGIEVGGGYRFGDLRDPDFAVRGGHGWFVVFGARITERLFPTTLDFWRPRF